MALNISDIKRIAHLARIEISEAEAGVTLTKLIDPACTHIVSNSKINIIRT